MNNSANKLSSRSRQILFWLAFVLLMAGAGYFVLRFIGGQLWDYMIWNKLINDIDHRWQPNERKDINSDGLRSFREADAYPSEDFNIIVAGDSFVFGHLLSLEQAPPFQLELLLKQHYPQQNINVINFGWSSSSPILSLRLLQDKATKYHPKLVLFVLDITDYKDDFFYRNVINPSGFYQFFIEHPVLAHPVLKTARLTDNYTGWQQQLLGYPDYSNYFVVLEPPEKLQHFFDGVYSSLLAMHHYVTETLNAELIVFIPPRHWQYTDKESPLSWEKHNYEPYLDSPYLLNNFDYFEHKKTEAPFSIISLLEDFKNSEVFPTTFEGDSHWNPDGAKLMARLMYEHCLAMACLHTLKKTKQNDAVTIKN